MDRLERLINLTAALLEAERPLTADELHQRLPGYADSATAFRRAFERDKDVLREMGVPLVLEPVDPMSQPGVEGYRIPKDEYYLQDPGLDPDELAALHLAASAVELEGTGGVEALWKLGGWVAEEGPPPAMAALPGAVHLSAAFADQLILLNNGAIAASGTPYKILWPETLAPIYKLQVVRLDAPSGPVIFPKL